MFHPDNLAYRTLNALSVTHNRWHDTELCFHDLFREPVDPIVKRGHAGWEVLLPHREPSPSFPPCVFMTILQRHQRWIGVTFVAIQQRCAIAITADLAHLVLLWHPSAFYQAFNDHASELSSMPALGR